MTGPELKAARRALGLTQAQLAKRWGVGLRTLNGWERSDAVPGWVADAVAGVEKEMGNE